MTVNEHNSDRVSTLLTALRDIEREPASSEERMLRIARSQADMLNEALVEPPHELPRNLSSLFPTIAVEYTANMPVSGLTYWSGQRWYVRLHSDATEEHASTTLHLLKRIIDHPQRQQSKDIPASSWDAAVRHFVERVLTCEATILA